MTFANFNNVRFPTLRWEVIKTALAMNQAGLNQGKSGNVSTRVEDGFLITPTGIDYDALQREDIVHMQLDGRHEGTLLPSSEWRFHRDIYAARADVAAIVHTHSAFATTLACHHREIPAFHYMVAVAGGDNIRCAPYATFGSQALSDAALAALEQRQACLLAQHGMIACGSTLKKALALAVEVETLAQMYWQALQIGTPPLLDAAEMQTVLEKFKTYGQQPAEEAVSNKK
jgi:L-fuculose-phosphate aldolase